MSPILQKTLGGLSSEYYIRQLVFGFVIFGLLGYAISHGDKSIPIGTWLFMAINTALYPYSRFIYERIVGFILGNNIFFVSAIPMLLAKLFTMIMCWIAAIFVAPIGLIYLYILNSKSSR